MLVDTFNHVIGSIFYQFLDSQSHKFFESHFFSAGEEIFILGTSATDGDANVLFNELTDMNTPRLLQENTSIDTETTDISFGCSLLNDSIDTQLLKEFLEKVDNGDILSANSIYLQIIERIRSVLAIQLDLKKFNDISETKDTVILLRNLVYVKTLQYKSDTKALLKRIGNSVDSDPEIQNLLAQNVGREFGLGDRSHEQILSEIERLEH